MQAVGMIAEFNPLHHGHVFALAQARKLSGADCVVVAMAGNYVQRGEPALVDKWTRAQMALASGADLVIELPPAQAVQAAPQFAMGGVRLLAALGVSSLAFGTENAALDHAAVAAKLADLQAAPPDFVDHTQTYATQVNAFYEKTVGVSLTSPNLLLGISYAQAIHALGARMQLVPFERRGAGHDEAATDGDLASGSQIRAKLAAGEDISAMVPPATLAGLKTARQVTWDVFFPWLRYRLETASLDELRGILGMTEGLEFRLTQQIAGAADFTTFMARIKSKRYTYARLRRLCLAVVLNLRAVDVAAAPLLVHVLGFTPAGQAYLHQVKKTASLPIISRPSLPMLAPGGEMALTAQCDHLIETLTGTQQNFARRPIQQGASPSV
ncbi:nucleotidyltransferase [Lacticaseibacillus yichunensis]|uniref:tRNA(Met) cytidine acetate ligase n=1 Tax=Lacticaseibacillus yichunensis TaxID=2486015 RepID=A0ABW4CNT4_9LACO|nr:nucleotidyltransferase [Lacticaseibacillus yichunensis]